MAKALFASVNYVKKKSIINGSVDPEQMVQFIETAQDMHIQNYMGSALYKKVQNLIVSETIGNSENEKYRTLLDDFIKPMLAWYAQSEFIPFAAYSISKGGIFKHRSDNSDSVDRSDIAALASRAKDNASFYADRFTNYMCDNSNDYPEYNTGDQDMTPDHDVDSFGWYLG
jgi:hypothetical protein